MPVKIRMRYCIAVMGITLLILRIVFPQLRIDEISVLLFSISALILLIPDTRGLIHRVQRLKLGGVEFELGKRIQELSESADDYAASLEEPASAKSLLISEDLLDRVFSPNLHPRQAFLLIAVQIEKTVKRIAAASLPRDDHRSRPHSTTQQLRQLVKAGILDSGIFPIFREFWSIRTRILYTSEPGVADHKIYGLLDLGIKVLGILRSEEERLS